jgi:hypothetical protein
MRKFVPILALLLAGCGEVRWAKPDGDTSSLAQDEASCRAAASEQVQRQYGPPAPAANRHSDPKYGADPGMPSQSDRRVLEAQAVNRCMRARGYALVPVGNQR